MTTNAAAMPSLNVTTSIPFNVMRARKKTDDRLCIPDGCDHGSGRVNECVHDKNGTDSLQHTDGIEDPGLHNLKKHFLSLTFHTAKCCDRSEYDWRDFIAGFWSRVQTPPET